MPAPERPERPARLDGLDAARGLAVVSMLVAHLCPVGGVLGVSELLTAPLFAVIIGVAMGLQLADRHPGAQRFLVGNVQRGLLLVVLGIVLQDRYAQIDVVLPYLGVLVVVLAPLALLLHRMPVLTLGVAAAGAAVGPLVVERARLAAGEHAASWPAWWADVVQWLATGGSYRLVSFLPMALGGLALASVLRRATRAPEGYAVAAVLLAASAGAYLLGRSTPDGADPYSGTSAEVVGATLLATGTVVASFLALDLARRLGVGRALDPLLSTGRLALTAYTLQILWLALLSSLRHGARDDEWWILASSTLVVVGACWVLERWWGTGPLEWLVHRLRPRAPVRRHPGGVSGRSGGSR